VAGTGSAQDIHCRNALNALLFQTGTPTRQFMLVLATNRPEDLDPAVLDRVDVTLNIDLPDLSQRTGMVTYYFNLHVLMVAVEIQKQSERNFIQRLLFGQREADPYVSEDCKDHANLEKIACKLDGFSGREISKLFLAVQIAMLYAPPFSRAVEKKEETSVNVKDAGKSKASKGKATTAPDPSPGRLSMELLWDTVMSKHRDHQVKLFGFNARDGIVSVPPSPTR
jgi:SpoVK/Ycf46/Vps4 family AAA+-type ATPase